MAGNGEDVEDESDNIWVANADGCHSLRVLSRLVTTNQKTRGSTRVSRVTVATSDASAGAFVRLHG